MGQKRKRQEESETTGGPVTKKQATEKSSSNSAAERRQKRSERRVKKAHQSKTNASRNGKKNNAKYEPKNKDKSKKKSRTPSQPAASPELVQASSALNDNLAQGQDFIPLTDPASHNSTDIPSSQFNVKKAKRASPRSERKKAKAEQVKLAALEGEPDDTTSKSTADPRFIVFVGNLPFTATDEQITSHFRKLNPISMRHPTDKSTGKSRGFAFIEFDNYSSQKTALKVYHHSMFDPERTSRLPDEAFDENGIEIVKPGQETKKGSGRRINVELSAGGGGKGEARMEKIRVKNTRLEEQRDRRREAEMKAEKAKSKKNKSVSDANAVDVQQKEDDGRGDIHPSRLKRVKA